MKAAASARPRLHFTPQSGWINDPYGVTLHDGHYHLFYQYVPGATSWQPNCHWGHAIGDDLFSFIEQPFILEPGDGDDGVWSGSVAVNTDGVPFAFYTSVQMPAIGVGRIRVATSHDDDWLRWAKQDAVTNAPDELRVTAFRDPYVYRRGSNWCMVVGAGAADGTAMTLRYESDDLKNWVYRGVMAQRSSRETQPVWTGSLWECPQHFAIGNVEGLVFSVWDHDELYYAAYRVEVGGGTEATYQRLTYGPSYYAPTFFRDEDDRPCLMFWMREIAGPGWAGAHSVPYVIEHDGDRLRLAQHPSLSDHLVEHDSADGVAVLSWRPGPTGTITALSDQNDVVATLTVGPDWLRLKTAAFDSTCPRPIGDPIQVLIDGPIIEAVVDGVLVGGPIRASQSIRFAPAGAGIVPELA